MRRRAVPAPTAPLAAAPETAERGACGAPLPTAASAVCHSSEAEDSQGVLPTRLRPLPNSPSSTPPSRLQAAVETRVLDPAKRMMLILARPVRRPLLKRFSGVSAASAAVAANVLPSPGSLLSLDELSDVFSCRPLFHRFPRAARFDDLSWRAVPHGSGSKSQAKKYALKNRRPGPGNHESDMCSDGDVALRHGAPPPLVNFHDAWGGLSLFVPIGERGQAAWRYAHETLAVMPLEPHLPCHVSFDPVPVESVERFKYVFDRSVGRSWTELCTAGVSQLTDRPCFPGSDCTRLPLFHHILLTPSAPTPKAEIDWIARCEGWEACERITFNGPTAGECTVNGVYTPPPGFDDPIDGEIDTGFIDDEQLRDVECLLHDGLVYADAAMLEHRVEALFYMFLFQTEQAFFSGRLDRVFALDEGRCAEMLLAAAEYAFPGGCYGRNFWAHNAVGPITSAAREFLARRSVRDSDSAT